MYKKVHHPIMLGNKIFQYWKPHQLDPLNPSERTMSVLVTQHMLAETQLDFFSVPLP